MNLKEENHYTIFQIDIMLVWKIFWVRIPTSEDLITLSHPDAVSLAREMGTIIQFDQQAVAPYFNYIDTEGNERVVWFEDASSILAKFKLMEKYNLQEIAYWKLALSFPQNWLLLNHQYNIK